MYKCGEIVYFATEGEVIIFNNVGVIIKINDDSCKILKYGSLYSSIYEVKNTHIRPISDKDLIIKEIKQHYQDKIDDLKSKIKSIKRSDYNNEMVSKYMKLKYEIKNTAKHMLESEDDIGFENRLKAICEKKKQMFSIKCEGMNDARKFNGEIKYQIKDLQNEEVVLLKNLDKTLNTLISILGS